MQGSNILAGNLLGYQGWVLGLHHICRRIFLGSLSRHLGLIDVGKFHLNNVLEQLSLGHKSNQASMEVLDLLLGNNILDHMIKWVVLILCRYIVFLNHKLHSL